MTTLLPQPLGIPLPRPTELTAPHWEAAMRGELRVQRCELGHYTFIPLPMCNQCYSKNLDWVKTSGRGTLYSMTVVHRPQTPAFTVPYVVAVVAMEEGWYMMSNDVDAEIEDLKIDMPLQVSFRKMSDEIALPYFVPI